MTRTRPALVKMYGGAPLRSANRVRPIRPDSSAPELDVDQNSETVAQGRRSTERELDIVGCG